MKKFLLIVLVPALIWASGCAELAQTSKLVGNAFVQLFRLPIYIIRVPFLILQNLGPILQSAVRTAANLAPLLLFVENQEPPKGLNPDPARPGELEESVRLALASPDAVPLLPLLDRETTGAARRFLLVDARLAADPRARAAVLGALGASPVRVVRVDGSGIFEERERFLSLSRRMRARGDMLVAATAFNDALAALVGPDSYAPPDEPAERAFVRRMERALQSAGSGARRGG